ncbi:MAG: metallophosphoesterase [Anaerolineales bacterium]|nr:metallophosphoesterase [Anaerolineales bacterium]
MLIGILSDIHDNLLNLEKALAAMQAKEISTVIFCGDFCSPIPCRMLAEYPGEIHIVFGNGDGDRLAMYRMTQGKNITFHGEHMTLDVGGAKIAVTHYPFYAQALARTGDYNAVFSGHSHQQENQYFGETLWFNPGDVMGWQNPASIGVFNTETNKAEVIYL